MIRIILLLGFVCTSFGTMSEELEELKVDYKKGTFFVTMVFTVSTSIEHVRSVLADYKNLSDLDPSIIEIQILEPPDEKTSRVKTLLDYCVLFFCKRVVRTEDVIEVENGDFVAKIVPELSNIKSGVSIWSFETKEEKIKISFSSRIEPAFWIPPLIGPPVLKADLERHLRLTARKLEELAK